MRRLTIYFLFILNFWMISLASHAEMTEEEAKQQLNSILGSVPAEMDKSWRDAVLTYFSKCSEGQCPCVLGVTVDLQVDTGKFWFGGFRNGQPQEMYNQYGRLNTNAFNGTAPKKLGKCHAARQNIAQRGDLCCATFANPPKHCKDSGGGEKECCSPCSSFRETAASFGISESQPLKHIYYASTLSGVIYLHDNDACTSPPCKISVACPTVEKFAMKDLCQKYIGQDASASMDDSPVTEESYGGVFYYFNQGTASEEAAAQGLMIHAQKCADAQYATLGSGGSASAVSQTSSDNNNGGNRSSGKGEVSSGGGGPSGMALLGFLGAASPAILGITMAYLNEKDASDDGKSHDVEEAEMPAETRTVTVEISNDPMDSCKWVNGHQECPEE